MIIRCVLNTVTPLLYISFEWMLNKSCSLAPATIKHIKGDLLHFTYLTIEDQVHQINRFTAIQAQDNFENGKRASWLSILFSPAYKFIKHYFFHLGFLDGYYGFLICRNMAHSTFLKHAKLMALWKNANR